MISGGLMTVGTTILIVGLVMMIVLPLVPMIYFFTGIMSWLLQVMELMFAWPLLLLRMFTPAREASLFGSEISRALLATLGLFLRPFFMVVGLVIAMMVISVMLYILHTFFGRLMFFDGISGADTVPDLAGFAATAVNSAIGLVVMVFLLIVYVLLAFLTVLFGSQIIVEFGETAMNLIGAGLGRFTQPGAIADKTVMAGGLGYMGARSAGMRVGSAHNQLGKLRKQGQDNSIRNLPRPTQ